MSCLQQATHATFDQIIPVLNPYRNAPVFNTKMASQIVSNDLLG